MIAILHRCVSCWRPWLTFTSLRRPDVACPFCGHVVDRDLVEVVEVVE